MNGACKRLMPSGELRSYEGSAHLLPLLHHHRMLWQRSLLDQTEGTQTTQEDIARGAGLLGKMTQIGTSD